MKNCNERLMDEQRDEVNSEDSDTSSNNSTVNLNKNNRSSNDYPQFSVLRSDSGGLRMKISAIRGNTGKDNSADNNNITNNKTLLSNKQKNKNKRKMSSYSSTCCSSCSVSDYADSVDIKIAKNKKKVKLKKKKLKDYKADDLDFYKTEKIFKNKRNESSTDPLQHSIEKCHLQLTDVLNSGCISSSDNELPELVNEAIRRVNASESDTDNNLLPPQQQYTSSLLQDFMAKTQMLGSSFNSELITESISTSQSPQLNFKADVVDEKSTQNSSTIVKRKRGRPKRTNNPVPVNQSTCSENINNNSPNQMKIHNPDETSKLSITSKTESQSDSLASSNVANKKPKLDLRELEKQIYATERTLYPPRNKKKISQNKTTPRVQKKVTDSLDPLWKKIDINAKFRRPSLSGYKSDGGSTICSKILAAKSGYVSDYGGYCNRNYSGYKSDVSCKSHCSTKTCASRAKSCDFRSSRKMRKVHRKRRNFNVTLSNKHTKSMSNLNDQDILQLAGLSLGQSSEESSRESICKPLSDSSKKYGEINRFVRTGEYYCSSGILDGCKTPNIISAFPETINKNISSYNSNKLNEESTIKLTNDTLYIENKEELNLYPRLIRSRRSSAVSVRSSCYSGYSRCKRYRKRRSKYFSKSSSGIIDSKLNTEIDILIDSFSQACHINCDKVSKDKTIKQNKQDEKFEKNLANKSSIVKKSIKKRKISENIETHHNSTSIVKRRHKKAVSSSPDEHKLPLKKRHYLLASREKLDGKNVLTDNYEFNIKEGVSPSSSFKINSDTGNSKNRHLLDSNSNKTKEDSSIKLMDHEKNLLKSVENKEEILNKSVHIKNNNSFIDVNHSKRKSKSENLNLKLKDKIDTKVSNYPPPGVFEPTIELEIQIPSAKLHMSNIITKSEIDSPLSLSKSMYDSPILLKGKECVVEKLLNKTGGDLLLKRRKRKKINRTGFPTVRKKKIFNRNSQNDENIELLDFYQETKLDVIEESQQLTKTDNIKHSENELKKKKKKAKLEIPNLLKTENKKLKESNLSKDGAQSSEVVIVKRPKGRPPGKKSKNVLNPIKSFNYKTVNDLNKKKREVERKTQIREDKSSKKSKQKALKIAVVKMTNKNTKTQNNQSKTKVSIKEIHLELKDNLEHDPLPLKKRDESTKIENDFEVDAQTINSIRKGKILKKSYLVAGLFSDYYKIPKTRKNSTINKVNEVSDPELEKEDENNLLPAPPYCEKFFRRSIQDFSLPHDIWLEYKNSKLSKRVNVPSWNYRKIRTNIYSADVVRPLNTDHQSCNCKMETACGDDCLNRMVYTECFPSTCPCRDKCQNQKIQKHDVAPGTERFMTENKGWGVRTNLPIKKGTYILEYVGEVVTEREFKERMATLYINDTHHYCLHLDGGLVIDGHRMGSDGRFVNHSCSPNCEMQKWSVNGLPRMALFASRNIENGEELTYDYNFSLFNPSEGQPCRCETPQCRGVIGGKSQRIKIEQKSIEIPPKHLRKRKRKAVKNVINFISKEIAVQNFQPLTDKEKKIVRSCNLFLFKNIEKTRKLKEKTSTNTELDISIRPLTPSSLAAQISALKTPRNIKTRGLTQAAHDPEIEKMAKIAVVLKEICETLEKLKDVDSKPLIFKIFSNSRRKRLSPTKKNIQDFGAIKRNIEKGIYKNDVLFDMDINQFFEYSLKANTNQNEQIEIIKNLQNLYSQKKTECQKRLAEITNKKDPMQNVQISDVIIQENQSIIRQNKQSSEDIIRCICGLFKDEGLMIQCSQCLVWQHAECTKADVKVDNYLCERCEPRIPNFEIPLEEFTEEGYRYYLSLLRGNLQIRQGDTVYVLRDIPIKNSNTNELTNETSSNVKGSKDGNSSQAIKKHTYETIGDIEHSECDIFRVERLWKDNDGKRFIFGHHFLRPHETFHEPSRKFYTNEVVRVPLYEVVPIELVIDRCWVFDRNTFCKGRPIDCNDENHVYICELRVDKTARFFTRAKQSYITCTKSYAFRRFKEPLKISRCYAPHDLKDVLASTKLKKRKNEIVEPCEIPPPKKKFIQTKKHRVSLKTITQRRTRLENVLLRLKFRKQVNLDDSVVDISYLLSGRGIRQRTTLTSASAAAKASTE